MTRIPIACTLTVADATDRVEEWRRFFAEHVDRVGAPSTTEASALLRDGDAALLAAADLATREKACCGFFTFTISIEAGARSLVVTVPDDAAPILADLVALARASH